MRTCLSYMAKDGIDPKKLDTARQFSRMFPEGQQVYLFLDGEHFHVFSEETRKRIVKTDLYQNDPKFRREINRRTYNLRTFRPDLKDIERVFEELLEETHRSSSSD